MATGFRLRSQADLDQTLRMSHRRPVFIFKHSATCPISARAWGEWRSFVAAVHGAGGQTAGTGEEGDRATAPLCAYLIVQEDRPVSQQVAQRLGVPHQSPQAILVRSGRAVWNASHHRITRATLQRALDETKDGRRVGPREGAGST